jgi:hypothetical protein
MGSIQVSIWETAANWTPFWSLVRFGQWGGAENLAALWAFFTPWVGGGAWRGSQMIENSHSTKSHNQASLSGS